MAVGSLVGLELDLPIRILRISLSIRLLQTTPATETGMVTMVMIMVMDRPAMITDMSPRL